MAGELELKSIIKDFVKLIADEDLVRNTKNDHEKLAFLQQGIRIVKILKRAELILGDNNGR